MATIRSSPEVRVDSCSITLFLHHIFGFICRGCSGMEIIIFLTQKKIGLLSLPILKNLAEGHSLSV